MIYYRLATNEEKQGVCAREYELLLGPNGFECCLTDIEDRTFMRDLSVVKDRLNVLEDVTQKLLTFHDADHEKGNPAELQRLYDAAIDAAKVASPTPQPTEAV